MSILLKHEDTVFEDQTIYATGNAYVGCTFRRCVLVVVGASNMVFDACDFQACVWHFNVVVHDDESVEAFQKLLRCARQSIPTAGSGPALSVSLN